MSRILSSSSKSLSSSSLSSVTPLMEVNDEILEGGGGTWEIWGDLLIDENSASSVWPKTDSSSLSASVDHQVYEKPLSYALSLSLSL